MRLVYRARQVVAALDHLKLYSEKIRRLILRGKVRSRYYLKKRVFSGLMGNISVQKRIRTSDCTACEFRHRKEKRLKSKVLKAILRVNMFESQWLENVRYELYWKYRMRQVIDMLK